MRCVLSFIRVEMIYKMPQLNKKNAVLGSFI